MSDVCQQVYVERKRLDTEVSTIREVRSIFEQKKVVDRFGILSQFLVKFIEKEYVDVRLVRLGYLHAGEN